MNLHFLTYGDSRFCESKRLLLREAHKCGWFKSIEAHSPETLPPDRLISLKSYLDLPRGGGYWIWKPIIILRKFLQIPDGDFLLYADAGCVINSNARHRLMQYLELLRKPEAGCLAFQLPFPEEQYTRQDVFDFYDVPPGSGIRQSGQLMATIQFYKKCHSAEAILQDVIRAVDHAPYLFTDDQYDSSVQPTGFIESRHDQSIFSVVRKMHNVAIIPDDTYTADSTTVINVPVIARRRRIAHLSAWQRAKTTIKRLLRSDEYHR